MADADARSMPSPDRVESMNELARIWNALLAEPLSIVMAVVGLLCAVGGGLGSRRPRRDRLVLLLVALMSGVAAWMMASHWRWPN
ncbi:MAG TPA: hypothetical protein VHZ49_02660 [Methylomirabilota bacterium]|jgi:hypothetical protein|nr:hypothetical protein [Methylomirabilota bacterium]